MVHSLSMGEQAAGGANVTMTDRRAELLTRVMADVATSGLADRSLRELAAAVGSSHRMLLYHFGSRDGLVAAVVAAVEADQRSALVEIAEDARSPAEVVRRLWARVSSPELRPFVRLFFETTAYAARSGRPTDLTDPWLGEGEDATAALGVAFDPVEVRVGIAVMRGLLVDVVTTGDVDTATEALERFLAMWDHWRADPPAVLV
jgi:AcrR family transcriptional regulator